MNTYKIAIISSSISEERKSKRVALFLHNCLKSQYGIIANKIDLKEYAFPIFGNHSHKYNSHLNPWI